MMFQSRNDDFVTFPEIPAAPGLRHQVDAFCRPANKNDLRFGSRIQEALHLRAGFLISCSRALAQLMDPAMNVGAIYFVEFADRVNNRSEERRVGKECRS